jgi:hypothetical protein
MVKKIEQFFISKNNKKWNTTFTNIFITCLPGIQYYLI